MKKSFSIFLIPMLLMAGCTKQTMPEPLKLVKLQPQVGSDAYYEALRAYKKSDHAIAFGWWGGSNSPGLNPDMTTRYMGLPDSMDIVSLWGGAPKDTAVWEEMQLVRKQKGTRFVGVSFSDGKFLDATLDTNFTAVYDKGDSMLMVGFDLVAQKVRQSVDLNHLDGMDLDHEPNYCGCDWGLTKDNRKFNMFLQAMSKYFGPLSGSGKLLIVDGEYSMITPEVAKGLDYIITQAYGASSASSLQSRFNSVPDGFPSTKFVVTENMQQYKGSGTSFMVNGVDVGSVLGMAMFNPAQGRKGGFGGFLIEYDAKSNVQGGTYYYIRTGIQIQNPAVQ